jgi:hypothetical protein
VTWVCVILGIYFIGYGIVLTGSASNTDNIGLMFMLSVLSFILAIILYLIGGRIVTVLKIDDYYVWIKGVNWEYLSELAQWQYGFAGVPAGPVAQVVPTANRKCIQCGNNVLVTDKFCWRCGANLT